LHPPPHGYWFSNVVGGAIATGIAWGGGVRDPQTRTQIDRGRASLQAMQQHARPQKRPGAARGQISRGSGGGDRGHRRQR
jgi:hypothetical protein